MSVKINWYIFRGNLVMDFQHDSISASQYWLKAWELVKKLALPTTPDMEHFRRAYPLISRDFYAWCYLLLQELHNAGLHNKRYHKASLTYVQEFFDIFPDENSDEDIVLYFERGKGEALFQLGRAADGEAVYENLVQRLPDAGWAYIGWAREYSFWKKPNYAHAAPILQRALQRPDLQNRAEVMEELIDVYYEWGKDAKAEAVEKEYDALFGKDSAPDR